MGNRFLPVIRLTSDSRWCTADGNDQEEITSIGELHYLAFEQGRTY